MREIKSGDRFLNFMGHELRIMGIVENHYVMRYKRCEPFVKHKNEMKDFLKTIEATPKKLTPIPTEGAK